MGTGVGVNQGPSGGDAYPFASPPDALRGAFGTLRLAYRDDAGAAEPPLSVWWLHGFGSDPGSREPGTPDPVHDRELVVKDAAGRVVFDSTACPGYLRSAWPGRPRETVAWWSDDAACHLVYLTGTPRPADWYPAGSELHPRCHRAEPRALRAAWAGGHRVTQALRLRAGNNVGLASGARVGSVSVGPTADPFRARAYADARAAPGLGDGVRPGCDGAPAPLTSVGGARPMPGGGLALDAAGCLSAGADVRVTGAYGARTAHPTPGAVAFRNGCGPCCPCAFYARTYKGLARLYSRGRVLALEAQGARNLYRENKARWEAQKACREGSPLRLVPVPTSGCRASVGASFCNTTGSCLGPVVLRFTFRAVAAGADVTLSRPGRVCPPAYLDAPGGGGEAAYVLAGSWPVYDAILDRSDPRSTARVRFRACADGCSDGDLLDVTMTVHAPDPPGASLPSAPVPPEVTAYWGASPPPYPARYLERQAVPVRRLDPYTPCAC